MVMTPCFRGCVEGGELSTQSKPCMHDDGWTDHRPHLVEHLTVRAHLLGHCAFDDGQILGKARSAAYFDECGEHRVGEFVRVGQRRAVGEHRDVELVDV